MTFSERASDVPAGAHCILVVDSEVLIRMVIAQYLRDCGYRVIEAVSAEEALTILNHPELAVDVVLSDVEQGGPMDGFGLAQWARANKPGVTVVLAASATRAAGIAADLCEASPLLSRPYDRQVLLDRIKRSTAGRVSASPAAEADDKGAMT